MWIFKCDECQKTLETNDLSACYGAYGELTWQPIFDAQIQIVAPLRSAKLDGIRFSGVKAVCSVACAQSVQRRIEDESETDERRKANSHLN